MNLNMCSEGNVSELSLSKLTIFVFYTILPIYSSFVTQRSFWCSELPCIIIINFEKINDQDVCSVAYSQGLRIRQL